MFLLGNKTNFFFPALFAFVLSAAALGCVKTEFDEPPVGGDPVTLTPTTTIKELKSLHVTPGGFDKITDDLIIGGEVVLDDRSGNYYKTIVIQDETGGIEVKFNDGFLYQQFPIGRKIYIRCQDMILTDYNGLTQLVGSTVEENGVFSDVGITEAQVRAKVVKGAFSATPIAPKVLTISQLGLQHVSTFIRLENVQFARADTGKTFADPVTQFSLNRTVETCGGMQIVVRTSGFANFAGKKTPGGKGTIEGILGVFGTTYQLALRDENAVQMTAPRCGASSGSETLVDISTVRSLFTGTATAAPADQKIKGIVISDRTGKNLNSRNLFLQDGTAGIVVRFEAEHSFNLGDEIEVIISEREISEFNKLLQVTNVPLANAKVIGTGRMVTPRKVTIAEINTNFNAWESTLVEISNATITGGTTLASAGMNGSRTVNDGTGTIALFTLGGSTFVGTAIPTAPVTLTAIISEFSTTNSPNSKQLVLRNAGDIQP